MKLSFELRADLPSANNLLRMHWAKRRKMVEDWHWLVKQALQKQGMKHIGNTSRFKTLVRIDALVYIKDGRSIKDRSNLITPIDKLIVDNLVKELILVDDTPEYLEWGKIDQEIVGYEGVVITLTEAG